MSLGHLRFYYWKFQVAQARKALNGSRVWGTLDALKIPGFGTQLIRLFYPLNVPDEPLWGYSVPKHEKIEAVLKEREEEYLKLLPTLEENVNYLADWPMEADNSRPELPHLNNILYSIIDALVLTSLLKSRKPKRYFEVGSGTSTKIANQARKTGGFDMSILSIDPSPRAEVDKICDKVIRKILEHAGHDWYKEIQPGDVMFFDGSHHCFPGNDCVFFLLHILPSLPPGVLVHIHDIYWPYDYPPEMLKHLWSEQYMLGTWLMGGGRGVKTIFPTAFMTDKEEMQDLVTRSINHSKSPKEINEKFHRQGVSFWFETT